MSTTTDYKSVLGVVIGAGVLIGGFVCLAGYLSKCQKCDKWWTKNTILKEKVKEEEAAKDVERHDKHYDKEGKYTGETTRQERVYGKKTTYKTKVKCSNCKNLE